MAESDVPHRGIPPPNDGLAAARVAFPRTQEDFANDDRVSFSKLENKWQLEDDDGSQWEYNETIQRWMPSVDQDLIEQQRSAYAVEGVDESEDAPAKKRKKHQDASQDDSSAKRKKENNGAKPERKNTAIYVTSLPLDVTVEEVQAVFSRFGVIAEEIDTGAPRIKLYRDSETGKLKGDALIIYFRWESVQLAIDMLDDTDFRLGQEGPAGKMKVTEADSSYKKVKEQDKKAPNAREKKKIIQKTKKMNNKLADWDDDDPSALQETSSRWDKVLILKHMFTTGEIKEKPEALLEIKEDIREECAKFGEVTNVVLYDLESEGIVSVRFGNPQAAKAGMEALNGRWFAQQRVEAFIASGDERFKKTKAKALDDEDEEESRRLDEFGQWLEHEQRDQVGGGEEAR